MSKFLEAIGYLEIAKIFQNFFLKQKEVGK